MFHMDYLSMVSDEICGNGDLKKMENYMMVPTLWIPSISPLEAIY